MDLILWRHAEAEYGPPDLQRKLTGKGIRQAQYSAAWLRERVPLLPARDLRMLFNLLKPRP